MDCAGDFRDKLLANFAFFIAHRHGVENHSAGRLGNVDIFGHAAPRRFDGIADVV
jgi:hypothetical protein